MVLNSLNDPIVDSNAIPMDALTKNPNCLVAITSQGGHTAWPEGIIPSNKNSWLNRLIVQCI